MVAAGNLPLNHRTVDHYLWDPAHGRDSDGVIYGHGDYFTGPAYPTCLAHLEQC